MIFKTMPVGPLQCNCILLGCEKTKEAILVDPGDEANKILTLINGDELSIKFILHTHAHFDHVGATKEIREKVEGPICLHAGDKPLYENLIQQGLFFGMTLEEPRPVEKWITDGDSFQFGSYTVHVLHTPGHTPGSVCFEVKNQNLLLTGDTLFRQSVGRTDLWGGSSDLLLKSIHERLLIQPDDTNVYPGHGPKTSIGFEKRNNPFLTGSF